MKNFLSLFAFTFLSSTILLASFSYFVELFVTSYPVTLSKWSTGFIVASFYFSVAFAAERGSKEQPSKWNFIGSLTEKIEALAIIFTATVFLLNLNETLISQNIEIAINSKAPTSQRVEKLRWLVSNKINLAGIDLEGIYLSGYSFDLSSMDFSFATFAGANLSKSNLNKVNFKNANLSDANLSEASLQESELIEADLGHSNLQGANLTKAKLMSAILENSNLNQANLRGANFSPNNSSSRRVSFRGADLSSAIFTNANLERTIFDETTITNGADFTDAILAGATLVGADFSNTNIHQNSLDENTEIRKTSFPAGFELSGNRDCKKIEEREALRIEVEIPSIDFSPKTPSIRDVTP